MGRSSARHGGHDGVLGFLREFHQLEVGRAAIPERVLLFLLDILPVAGAAVAGYLMVGWSWWLVAFGLVGVLGWVGFSAIVDRLNDLRVRSRMVSLAGARSVPVDLTAWREKALDNLPELMLPGNDRGKLFEILRSLGVPSDKALKLLFELDASDGMKEYVRLQREHIAELEAEVEREAKGEEVPCKSRLRDVRWACPRCHSPVQGGVNVCPGCGVRFGPWSRAESGVCKLCKHRLKGNETHCPKCGNPLSNAQTE